MSNSYTLEQIKNLDVSQLAQIMHDFGSHSPETVLLAFGEFSKRGWIFTNLDKETKQKVYEFCGQHGFSNIDDQFADFVYRSKFHDGNDNYYPYFEKLIKWKDVNNKSVTDDSKYPALNTISIALVIVALGFGILSIVGLFYWIGEKEMLLGVVSFIVGAFFTLIPLVISESIRVMLDIEMNTRQKQEK